MTEITVQTDVATFILQDSRYIRTANGGYRLASTLNPSPYADDSTPDTTPSENLRRKGREADLALGEYAAVARSESKARGEGHARETREYLLGEFVVPTPEITSAEQYRAWLKAVSVRLHSEDSEYALWVICKQAAMNDVRNLRVMERDLHDSVAEEAASMASLALLTAETTLRVMGDYKDMTLLEASLAQGKGSFPIMRMVGFECQNATMTVLRDKGITFNQTWGNEYATRQDYAAIDAEQAHDVNGWIRSLANGANAEEMREGNDSKTTLRRDMWTLYRMLRYNLQIEADRKGSTEGHKNRDAVAASLGWSRAKFARTKMELQISRAFWFKSDSDARAEEATLREAYRKGFIGDKLQQKANREKVAA